MSQTLTAAAQNALAQEVVEPQLVLEIDGVSTVYGTDTVFKSVEIDDPGLEIGNDWTIGGLVIFGDQSDNIVLDGTSTQITQQLNPDKANVTSISSVQIALLDVGGAITELISPGFVVDDLLMRRARLWMGFKDTAYKEDFLIVFRGVIDDILADQGKITLNIASPDQKKRQDIFQKVDAKLNGDINASVTTITVDTTDNYLEPVLGPDGLNDPSLTFYIRIDDEIIKYTSKNATQFLGCIRAGSTGNLDFPGNVAAIHTSGTTVNPIYRLTGNAIDLALKIMLSGWGTYFETGRAIESFNRISAISTISNAIFFLDMDLELELGIVVGDYITTTGATNGANNVTLKTISEITKTNAGTYIIINDVTFVYEASSPGTASFRSQYDTLGEGLQMYPDEVDIAQHLKIFTLFLSALEYDFYIKDTITGWDFINGQIYLPASMYSVPRKARSSVQYHIGPIPGTNIVTLDNTNVMNASKIRLRRTISKNFYNTIIYEYDYDVIQDKYLSGFILDNEDSKNRIPAGTKSLVIPADGIRTSLSGASEVLAQSTTRLNRYAFAAEFFEQIEALFSVGFNIEIGDIILFDGSLLNVPDTKAGHRGMAVRFFETVNKKLDLRTGQILLSLTDTGFSTSNRYCLISPSSEIKSATASILLIQHGDFSSPYGDNEGNKWSRYPLVAVRVHNPASSNTSNSVIQSVSGTTINVAPVFGYTPASGDVLDLSTYDGQTDQVKLVYGHMRDTGPFSDGRDLYRLL